MKPTNPNAHTYVEDDGDKVSIMIGHENVNAHTYRRTVEQHGTTPLLRICFLSATAALASQRSGARQAAPSGARQAAPS